MHRSVRVSGAATFHGCSVWSGLFPDFFYQLSPASTFRFFFVYISPSTIKKRSGANYKILCVDKHMAVRVEHFNSYIYSTLFVYSVVEIMYCRLSVSLPIISQLCAALRNIKRKKNKEYEINGPRKRKFEME